LLRELASEIAMHTYSRAVDTYDEYYFRATLTREDYDEFSFGLAWRRQDIGQVYFFLKDQSRYDLEPIVKELTFKGSDVEVKLTNNRIEKLDRIDASRVELLFSLELRAQDGAAARHTRHILGSNDINKVDLRRDDSARNVVRTGDGNDEIHLGSHGGEVSAGKGRNVITAGWGRDEIIINAADSTTCQGGSETNLTTVQHFRGGQDKVRILFNTRGIVSDDAQRRIDEALAALPSGTPVCEKYEAAKDVAGVENGHVFCFRDGFHYYIGIDNPACTLIDIEPGRFPPPAAADILFF
jgi:hypothetical protein